MRSPPSLSNPRPFHTRNCPSNSSPASFLCLLSANSDEHLRSNPQPLCMLEDLGTFLDLLPSRLCWPFPFLCPRSCQRPRWCGITGKLSAEAGKGCRKAVLLSPLMLQPELPTCWLVQVFWCLVFAIGFTCRAEEGVRQIIFIFFAKQHVFFAN